jgi:hypothetical protein
MRAFGNRLRSAEWELRRGTVDYSFEEHHADRRGDPARAIMQIVVSLIVLGAGFFTLATGSDEATKAAAGVIGTVVGYWLS